MRPNHTRYSGFTIVELLIVIVVIGILAAITITAYNGVQSKARNTSTIQTARIYLNALALYLTDNNAYPTVNSTICLGGTYKDYSADGVGDCGYVNQSYRGSVDATFATQMKQYLGNRTVLPNVSTTEISSFGDVMVGAFINNWNAMTLDGNPNPYYIMYNLEGTNQDCVLSIAQTNGTWPQMIRTSQKYTWSDSSSKSTTCVIPLANP
jgi:prepilin-type N-terminal cleavage/methylation domain-containing protein